MNRLYIAVICGLLWAYPSYALTPTETNTRRPTATRTTTRTLIPTKTRTATFTRRPTLIPTAHHTTAWTQPFGGPGRNGYRGDVQLNPMTMEKVWEYKAPPGESVGTVQALVHPVAGTELVIFHGDSGFYDNWQRLGRDHQCPAYVTLIDYTTKQVLANAGCPATWSATYEGSRPAFWPHPTLLNYTIGATLEGGYARYAVWGSHGNQLSVGLPGGYIEQVGLVVVSPKLGVVCYEGYRGWHGGTAPEVKCTSLDGNTSYAHWKGRSWYVGITDPDAITMGGIAIAESSGMVVASINRLQERDQPQNGLYVWPVKGTGIAVRMLGGLWAAPAISPDGKTAFVVHDDNTLVRLDTATGVSDTRKLITQSNHNLWSGPPTVTDKLVIVIENTVQIDGKQSLGELQAYDPITLVPVWRTDAQIAWHVDPLSGWRREEEAWLTCDKTYCYVAGSAGLIAIRQDDGTIIRYISVDPASPDGYYLPQIACEGTSDCSLLVIPTSKVRRWPECQEQTCPDGLPINGVDYNRCCAGITPFCPSVDCKVCEALIGWCPHDPERRRMEYPGTRVVEFK